MITLANEQLAAVRALVEAHFTVQEMWFQDGHPMFTIAPAADNKVQFLRLHQEVSGLGLLPLLRRREGETVLLFVPKPAAGRTSWLVPTALFAATLITTFLAGYMDSRGGNLPGLLNPVAGGVAFSLSLMAILVCHEMGHKLVSIWRGIDASPPYFIPMPPLPGLSIGTLGAVILTRTPAPNRDALVELGASGPIAGFLAAVPILIYGVRHSLVIGHEAIIAHGGQLMTLPTPLFVNILVKWLLHPGPAADVIIHPMALAGWVGLLVTALNLLPASMLDGGHVTRAVFGPRLHLILSYIAVGVGILLGYWIMSLLILVMIRRGHPGPLDDISPATPFHQVAALALAAIFVLSAVPLAAI
jgi:hypothetical protein